MSTPCSVHHVCIMSVLSLWRWTVPGRAGQVPGSCQFGGPCAYTSLSLVFLYSSTSPLCLLAVSQPWTALDLHSTVSQQYLEHMACTLGHSEAQLLKSSSCLFHLMHQRGSLYRKQCKRGHLGLGNLMTLWIDEHWKEWKMEWASQPRRAWMNVLSLHVI